MLDVRSAQTDLENLLRDAVLYALGKRLKPVASIAELRNLSTRGGQSSMRNDDDLIALSSGGSVSSFRWSGVSAASDDGANVIKPNDVTGQGRWISWTTPLRIAPVVGGNSSYLHELTSGPLQRVVLLDRQLSEQELYEHILGQTPSVVIEATGDAPVDATYEVGWQWLTEYHFRISVVSQNYRDRREAAQGSQVAADPDPGANALDGLIWSVIAGTGLFHVNDAIRNVKPVGGSNWISELRQRRVVRSRDFAIQATVTNPAAPNDTAIAEGINVQEELADLDSAADDFDVLNYITSGLSVSIGVGLSKTCAAGAALVDGVTATYAGALLTFPANSDTYRDLLPNGTLVLQSVATDESAPSLTATSLRIGITRTDGSSVLSDTFIAASSIPQGNPIDIPLT